MYAPLRVAVLLSILVTASCDESGPTQPLDPILIETETLAEAIEGQPYAQSLEAAGGSGSYTWVLAAGSLPAGLTLAPAGSISGTAIAPGTSSFRVRATDVAGQSSTADLSLTVVQALTVHTLVVAEAVMGEPYSVQLQAVGGRGTYTWSVVGGEAASWLTLSTGGLLSGTPATSGASSITVEVTDESGQEAQRELSIAVLGPLAVAAINLPPAVQGRAYAAQLVATGGSGTYTWSLESGTLPTGVGLTSGGALTGSPGNGGTFTFTARVSDSADRIATRLLSLTVERAPTIQTQSLPPADIGVPYAAQLEATGGTGTYTWSVTDGALPQGLTLSASGAISGTATTSGSASFTVQVVDEASITHTRAFTIVVADVSQLASGVPVTGVAGGAGSVRYYSIDVPAGATGLTVSISGGTGDVDLYVRRALLPAEFSYDCRPLREGNEETCTFTPPAEGRWYIMLRGFTEYAGVTLVATYEGA